MAIIDYQPMWQELGLDLQAHDDLLQGLGTAYQGIFLSQKNRPHGSAQLEASFAH